MSKVAIYGAGNYGSSFLSAIQEEGGKVDFFIDQYTDQKERQGVPVCRVNEVVSKDTVIYISIPPNPLDTAACTGIKADLESQGFCRVSSFTECLHLFSGILPALMEYNILWMRGDRREMLDHDKLRQVRGLLSDDASRALLDDVMLFREKMTPESYVEPDSQEEYFPDDINLFSSMDRLRFVDAGAYIGDTVKSAVSFSKDTGLDIEYIVSFEPDLKNVDRLKQEVAHSQSVLPTGRFFINASGLWSRPTTLRFSNNGNSSSSISEESADFNTVTVPVTSLDTCVAAASPNYIKMDIEGAEALIRASHPALAICVYHRPDDLWELPLLVHRMHPEYRMYLRIHGHMGLSMVLYCVP